MSVGKILRIVGLVGGVMMGCVRAAQAAICFLPDCEVGEGRAVSSESAKECLENGYQKIQGINCGDYSGYDYCPNDVGYVKCNKKLWCVENGYDKTECLVPEYLTDKCPNGEEFYKSCMADYEKACKLENASYVEACPVGWKLDEARSCTYSKNWGICCNECVGYEYVESGIPSGYVKGDRCSSCGGIDRYKIKADPCTGYQTCQNTPKSGTAQCLSGSVVMYKECCAYSCSLSVCPDGTECSLEVCSGKYCAIGCMYGYQDYCTAPVVDCAALGYEATICLGDKLACSFDVNKFHCF